MREWRNRQTRTFEGRVGRLVRVQVPSLAPFRVFITQMNTRFSFSKTFPHILIWLLCIEQVFACSFLLCREIFHSHTLTGFKNDSFRILVNRIFNHTDESVMNNNPLGFIFALWEPLNKSQLLHFSDEKSDGAICISDLIRDFLRKETDSSVS